MGKKSRDKGKRGERQARDYWRDVLGLGDVIRSQQYRGTGDSADLAETLKFHTEVKVGKQTPSVYAAISQATADCPPNKFPLVQLRRDREQWLFVMPEETFTHVMLWYMEAIKNA
jgi:hypothetical protein